MVINLFCSKCKKEDPLPIISVKVIDNSMILECLKCGAMRRFSEASDVNVGLDETGGKK